MPTAQGSQPLGSRCSPPASGAGLRVSLQACSRDPFSMGGRRKQVVWSCWDVHTFLKVPIAIKCCVLPPAMVLFSDGLRGLVGLLGACIGALGKELPDRGLGLVGVRLASRGTFLRAGR